MTPPPLNHSSKAFQNPIATALLAFVIHGVSIQAANIHVSSFGDNYSGSITFVEGDRPVETGTGFVAVGSFATWDETRLATAAGNAAELAGALGDFQTHGQSARFGGGVGVAGSFDLDATGAMMPGNPLVGKSIYVIGGTERGIFIFRTGAVFQADAPISFATVKLMNPDAGRFVVGSDGPAVTIDPYSSAQPSVVLSGSATGQLLDISRFEALVPVPQSPAPPASPGAPPSTNGDGPRRDSGADSDAGGVVAADPPVTGPPLPGPPVFPRLPPDFPGIITLIGEPIDVTPISHPGFSPIGFPVIELDDQWRYSLSTVELTPTALTFRASGLVQIPEPHTGVVAMAALVWFARLRRGKVLGGRG
jgi:hypothetical protein